MSGWPSKYKYQEDAVEYIRQILSKGFSGAIYLYMFDKTDILTTVWKYSSLGQELIFDEDDG